MRQDLITQIREGKALHYDIDNVELLNRVLKECFPKARTKATGVHKYYYSYYGWWECSDTTTADPIPLSSFLDDEYPSDEEIAKMAYSLGLDKDHRVTYIQGAKAMIELIKSRKK